VVIGLKNLSMKMKNSLSRDRPNIEDIFKNDSQDKSKFIFNQQNSHQKID